MYKEYKQEEHWDKHYKSKKHAILNYDNWLDEYIGMVSKNSRILDLGCGTGSDTNYMLKLGYCDVCSVDFSEEALRILHELVPNARYIKADMTQRLPFEDDSFDVVIADLSLHYFEWSDSMNIVGEIERILMKRGYLFARFNSNKDYEFGAKDGELIEYGLYLVNGRTKRFFSENDIDRLFVKWSPISKQEKITGRYSKKKVYWEFIAQNDKE